MATTLANSLRRLRVSTPRVDLVGWPSSTIRINRRHMSNEISKDSGSDPLPPSDPLAMIEAIKIPFQGIHHVREVPVSRSYFSRETQFNDLVVRFSNLFSKYHHLPVVSASQLPQVPWIKLDPLRMRFREPIKASHYAHLMRVVKRLYLIEPSLMPQEVRNALQELKRDIDPHLNKSKTVQLDKFGRAVASGRRKESTARAFVVEGTGEVLVNGKPLSDAFGRVHDRESAIWSLIVTHRVDKYNVWALVEGGGKTGQAEALALAVAKALVAHEPDLKRVLRAAGCITRDIRAVERKKHGHVKARKSSAWNRR